jgi:hypothetical protein
VAACEDCAVGACRSGGKPDPGRRSLRQPGQAALDVKRRSGCEKVATELKAMLRKVSLAELGGGKMTGAKKGK